METATEAADCRSWFYFPVRIADACPPVSHEPPNLGLRLGRVMARADYPSHEKRPISARYAPGGGLARAWHRRSPVRRSRMSQKSHRRKQTTNWKSDVVACKGKGVGPHFERFKFCRSRIDSIGRAVLRHRARPRSSAALPPLRRQFSENRSSRTLTMKILDRQRPDAIHQTRNNLSGWRRQSAPEFVARDLRRR